MGKVQKTFKNIIPGQISRAIDDIVITFPNVSGAEIAFGAPVFLDSAKGGVEGFKANAGMTTFVGVATRIGPKTPNVYGSDIAVYNANEGVSVITRGSVGVLVVGTAIPAVGGKVYLDSNGNFTADATGNTELTNCKFRECYGTNGCAEIVITSRNIQ